MGECHVPDRVVAERRLRGSCACVALGLFVCFTPGCGASHKIQPPDQVSCTTYEDECPGDERFYRSSFVRKCLQLEQQNLINDSQTCWAKLEQKIQSDPDFVSRERLTNSDVVKIRQKAAQSDRASSSLIKSFRRAVGFRPANETFK